MQLLADVLFAVYKELCARPGQIIVILHCMFSNHDVQGAQDCSKGARLALHKAGLSYGGKDKLDDNKKSLPVVTASVITSTCHLYYHYIISIATTMLQAEHLLAVLNTHSTATSAWTESCSTIYRYESPAVSFVRVKQARMCTWLRRWKLQYHLFQAPILEDTGYCP